MGERIRRGMQQRREAGLWQGGIRPFGFAIHEGRRVPHPVEDAWIRDLTQKVAAGG